MTRSEDRGRHRVSDPYKACEAALRERFVRERRGGLLRRLAEIGPIEKMPADAKVGAKLMQRMLTVLVQNLDGDGDKQDEKFQNDQLKAAQNELTNILSQTELKPAQDAKRAR